MTISIIQIFFKFVISCKRPAWLFAVLFIMGYTSLLALDLENGEIIRDIKESRHALAVEFDKGRIVQMDVLWTSDKKELESIMKTMRKLDYSGLSSRSMVCYNDIIKNNVKLGVSVRLYQLTKTNNVILPSAPFSFDISKVKDDKKIKSASDIPKSQK